MKLTDINDVIVKQAVVGMPKRFHTKDLSRLPVMLTAHEVWKDGRSYHSLVGRYLSRYRVDLGLRLIEEDEDEHRICWEKIPHAR